MSKEYTPDTIELYLKKQLKGEALQAFEEKMNTDAAFKKEIQTQQLLYRGANKAGEDDMREKLKKIRAEVLHEDRAKSSSKVVTMAPRKKPNPIFRWSIAAAVIIALGASLFWLLPGNDSSEDVFASYYEPYSEEITVRGNNEDLITQASQFYQKGNYQQALPIFQQVLNAETENAEIQLVIGICYLELNQYQGALQSFKNINNPLYKDQAHWYLAMTYLKQEDLVKAKAELRKIETGDFNYEKAQEILDK